MIRRVAKFNDARLGIGSRGVVIPIGDNGTIVIRVGVCRRGY
jgi:hypothetical protein